MRAIVIPGHSQLSHGRSPLGVLTPGVLSPLVDRPFLQHVVESILSHKVREIDFVMAADEEGARRLLGDGTRWGAKFRFHLPCGTICDSLKEAAGAIPGEKFLLAQSDRLPFLHGDANAFAPKLFCWQEKKLTWTGWGVVRTADILNLPGGLEEAQLFSHLVDGGGGSTPCEEGKKPLSAKSFADLVEANRRVLCREFPGLLVGGKEVQPGVWVSRNAKVHPMAKLRAPAFLGEHSRVGAMAEVGPSASIGKYCMIERETVVSDSVVCSGSYVGQHLLLKGVIVDRSRLINPKLDVEIEGVDELLLGSVFGAPVPSQFRRLCGRAAAAAALVPALPVLAAMFVASRAGWIPALRRQEMVVTPTVADSFRWKVFPLRSFGERQVPTNRLGWMRDFFLCFLPALPAIAAGHMGFAGRRPRTREEALRAAMFQNSSFLYSYPGFLQQGLFGSDAPDAELPGSPAPEGGWRESISLLARYAQSMVWNSSSTMNCCRAAATGGSQHEN